MIKETKIREKERVEKVMRLRKEQHREKEIIVDADGEGNITY